MSVARVWWWWNRLPPPVDGLGLAMGAGSGLGLRGSCGRGTEFSRPASASSCQALLFFLDTFYVELPLLLETLQLQPAAFDLVLDPRELLIELQLVPVLPSPPGHDGDHPSAGKRRSRSRPRRRRRRPRQSARARRTNRRAHGRVGLPARGNTGGGTAGGATFSGATGTGCCRSGRGSVRGNRLPQYLAAPLGDGLRPVLLGELERMIDRREQLAGVAAAADRPRRNQDFARAAEDALAAGDRVERRRAGDGAVARRAQPVDVGPRALVFRVAAGTARTARSRARPGSSACATCRARGAPTRNRAAPGCRRRGCGCCPA